MLQGEYEERQEEAAIAAFKASKRSGQKRKDGNLYNSQGKPASQEEQAVVLSWQIPPKRR
jgi:hypothetical protein